MRFSARLLLAIVGAMPLGAVAAQGDNPFSRPTYPATSAPVIPKPPPVPLVFFPPAMPAYGAPFSTSAPRVSPTRQFRTAPEKLADFVGDYFYSALGTRLVLGLDNSLAQSLDAYAEKRRALVNELLDELAVLSTADLAAREKALQALAARQTPLIVALEGDAEELRRRLIGGGLFGRSVDWSAKRSWRIGKTKFGAGSDKIAEYEVVRAAAYYQHGLSVQQRGLLAEAALELDSRLRSARARQPAARDDPAIVFFSPETSRWRFPSDLPPELTTLLARYHGLKARLKRELVDAVLAHDTSSASRRNEAFAAFAEEQHPWLQELENLAEQIRRALTTLPPPPAPPMPPIPPSLRERILAYDRERAELIAKRKKRIEEANEAFYASLFSAEMIRETREQTKQRMQQRADAARKAGADFDAEHREQTENLQRRYQQIRSDLAAIASVTTDSSTGQPIDSQELVNALNNTLRWFDQLGREEVIYANYKLAMLQPGLSPEQRRLLLGAARVALAQPLPPGESFPK